MTGIRDTSVAGRLRRFFIENPDEELTRADMVAKFGSSFKNIDASLTALRAEGLLESVHVTRLRTKGIASNPVTAPVAQHEIT